MQAVPRAPNENGRVEADQGDYGTFPNGEIAIEGSTAYVPQIGIHTRSVGLA